jgi:hypothetical protein
MTAQNSTLAACIYFDAATTAAGFIAGQRADDDASKPRTRRGQLQRSRATRRRNRVRCAAADETAIISFVAVSGR